MRPAEVVVSAWWDGSHLHPPTHLHGSFHFLEQKRKEFSLTQEEEGAKIYHQVRGGSTWFATWGWPWLRVKIEVNQIHDQWYILELIWEILLLKPKFRKNGMQTRITKNKTRKIRSTFPDAHCPQVHWLPLLPPLERQACSPTHMKSDSVPNATPNILQNHSMYNKCSGSHPDHRMPALLLYPW